MNIERISFCYDCLRDKISQEPATKGSDGFGGDWMNVKTAIVCLPPRNTETTATSLERTMLRDIMIVVHSVRCITALLSVRSKSEMSVACMRSLNVRQMVSHRNKRMHISPSTSLSRMQWVCEHSLGSGLSDKDTQTLLHYRGTLGTTQLHIRKTPNQVCCWKWIRCCLKHDRISFEL